MGWEYSNGRYQYVLPTAKPAAPVATTKPWDALREKPVVKTGGIKHGLFYLSGGVPVKINNVQKGSTSMYIGGEPFTHGYWYFGKDALQQLSDLCQELIKQM